MNECVTSVDLNFSNGGGGHTATVTSIVGAQSAQTMEDSLGEIVGDVGSKSSFSDSRIDDLMSRFVVTETTTNADPTKKTRVRKYVDSTALKLNSLIVLVRGINAPPLGQGEFEDKVAFFSEVKGTAIPSFGGTAPVEGAEKAPVIIAGKIYNMESRNMLDGEATTVNLVYQGKTLKRNLSLNDEVVPEEYRNSPDPSQYALKFGYTLNEFKQMLELAEINYDGLDVERGDDVLFETSGPLMGVVSSVASYYGFYYYINPQDGKLRFINSALAAQLTIADPTQTTNESVVAASFTRSGITDTIVNTYAGTAQNMNKSDMGGGGADGSGAGGPDLYKAFLHKVDIEGFKAFQDMNMSRNLRGAFFALFNQDQPPEMFDKFTYLLLILSERNVKQKGQFPDFKDSHLWRTKDNQGQLQRNVVRLAGNVTYDADEQYEKIIQPLYLPRPFNLELWSWGPTKGNDGATEVIWGVDDAKIKNNELWLAKKADLGHQFKRHDKEYPALYFGLACYKSQAQLAWEDIDEVSGNMPMSKPSQSPLYEFLKIYFQIAGGVYVSHGYGQKRALRMGFENYDNITVGGPYHTDTKIKDTQELAQLHNLFQILGIKREVTVGDLADKANKKAKAVNKFHFVGIRNIPKLGMRQDQEKLGQKARPFGADQPANFGPLGTHVEIYDKPNALNGASRFIGGPLLNLKFRTDRAGKSAVLPKYMSDLIVKSIDSYDRSMNPNRVNPNAKGDRRTLVVAYTLHKEAVHRIGDKKRMLTNG